MELKLDWTPTPRELVLKVAEGLELALSCDDLLDPGRPQGPDQLILHVLDADVRRSAEHPVEPAFLGGVAETYDALAVVFGERSTNRLRATDRHDLDSLGGKVTAELRRDCLERDAVSNAFDENHGHGRKLA
jgi:hypothetical protein